MNNQSIAEPSGDKNRDQPGFVEMQVESHAVQASAQGVMRLADAVLQRDSDGFHCPAVSRSIRLSFVLIEMT